jgi:hypothetical protein
MSEGFSIPLRLQGGVAARPTKSREASLAARPGWLSRNREAHLILLELSNHPVCAAKDRDHFINGAATPPWKGGEWRAKQR